MSASLQRIGISTCYRYSRAILGKDGDDAPLYLEKSIQQVLKKLEETENEEGEG